MKEFYSKPGYDKLKKKMLEEIKKHRMFKMIKQPFQFLALRHCLAFSLPASKETKTTHESITTSDSDGKTP